MLRLGIYVDNNDFSRWESVYRIGVINYNAKYRNKYSCPNRCVTCVGNGKFISEGLTIKKINTEEAFCDFIKNSIKKHEIFELVFTGIPRGEPLLDYQTVIYILKLLRKQNINILTRVNSGYNCEFDTINMLIQLRQSGLDRIAVTINALDKESYMSFCRPMVKNAYLNHINFIKDAYKVFGNEGFIVSYIDRNGINVPPRFKKGSFNQDSLKQYLKDILNLKDIKFKVVNRGYLGGS